MKKEKRTTTLKRRGETLIRAGFRSLHENGFRVTASKTARRLGLRGHVTAAQWARIPQYTKVDLEEQRQHAFSKSIRFSMITPLYNTPETYLREMIDSVCSQTYSNWELCLADGSDESHAYVGDICRDCAKRDSRIKYKRLDKNHGIAGNSNACIEMATGEYLALLDHDDILHPAALYEVMNAVCEEEADFIYTDEAVFESPDLRDVKSINFKPDFAIDTLRACNYICHFTAFKRTLIDGCGAFRDGFDGAQDHELFLRLTSAAKNIVHIPKVLYYWRAHEGSKAGTDKSKSYAAGAGIRAVTEHIEATGLHAHVESARNVSTHYRIRYELPDPEPKVSVIIPNYDHVEDLRCCIDSINEKTTYTNYEIIVVENNSTDPSTFAYYDELKASNENDRIRVIKWPGTGFNWSAINNYAVRNDAAGDYIILLNNDTEVISHEWIQEMLMYVQRPDVGIAGAMLYYPDDTIQHAGVIIGIGGTAGHAFKGRKRGENGYMGRLFYAHNVSAVTGACLMIRRDVFEEVDGIDEKLAVGWNDIDLCLRVREAGYLIVWTPFAELYHFESKSRGLVDDTPEKQKRAKYEKELFLERWAGVMEAGDPYYNPNLSLKRNYEIKERT